MSLDLADEGGRSVFHRLVSVSDVVIENFGSPVLDRWGCGYRSLLAHKPDLVMLSLSGYGRDGPRANYLAYGVTVASYLGLASAWGYAHGTLSDYIAGATGAVAAVAALGRARPRRHTLVPGRRASRCGAAGAGRALRACAQHGRRPRSGAQPIAGVMAVRSLPQSGT